MLQTLFLEASNDFVDLRRLIRRAFGTMMFVLRLLSMKTRAHLNQLQNELHAYAVKLQRATLK